MVLLGRNSECWCGSGKKYKNCHMDFDQKIEDFRRQGYSVPTHKIIKTPEQIQGIRDRSNIRCLPRMTREDSYAAQESG